MSVFKVGDKVEVTSLCSKSSGYGVNIGMVGEVANEEVELVTTHSFKPVDQEAKRKAAEKEALQKSVAEMQRQLDEMKQKLEKM